ncbi:hypothetical protein HO173_011818 [Letharia columbiana]|uniref:DUF7580 domain-containing protein n=1 Tax=Letharia columbiana TaxID=112416 RepID=A0A8H6CS63_9LECA|nr:uncharacterized protein HO173_011818 [Letharia columbiana]KAF6228583.1 hypothetical protein HO173_011818 [Letharia columbiana]
MKNPGGAFSHKPEYEERLSTRLGRSYGNYTRIMADMLESLEAARKELGIGENGEILWDDYSSPERQYKRLKLALSKNVYADLLSEIKEANHELKEFTKESHILESNRKKRRSKRQPVDFQLIRRQARSLYNVMVAGRSWRCGCQKYHVASLRLEPRPWEEDKGKDDVIEVKWKWRELEIEPMETSESPMAEFGKNAETLGISTLSLVSSSEPLAKKKAVSFAFTPPTKPTRPPAPTELSHTGMGPINDICTAVSEHYGVRQGIGFLTDEIVGQHRHDVYLVDDRVRQGTDPKSLEYLLHVSKQRDPGFSLSRRDRLYIAVILASSVLQLDGTLWLKKQWRSGDILFLPLEDRKSSAPKVDFAHPYVSWKVSPEDVDTALIADPTRSNFAHRIPSEILFVLGITLTELCFGQNIYEMRIQEDVDTTEVMTNFNTASRLIDYVYSESGSRYGDVVRRCLKCPPDVRDASLDNAEFQDAVFDSIVTPLRQDFEDFNGGSRIR